MVPLSSSRGISSSSEPTSSTTCDHYSRSSRITTIRHAAGQSQAGCLVRKLLSPIIALLPQYLRRLLTQLTGFQMDQPSPSIESLVGKTQLDIHTIWPFLLEGFEEIFEKPTNVPKRLYMNLHNLVYNYTNTGKPNPDELVAMAMATRLTGRSFTSDIRKHCQAELYKRVTEYLNDVVKDYFLKEIQTFLNDDTESLMACYVESWNRYSTASKLVSKVCVKLDKQFVLRQRMMGNEKEETYEIAMKAWYKTILQPLIPRFNKVIAESIDAARVGKEVKSSHVVNRILNSYFELTYIDQHVIKAQNYCLLKLSVYKEEFETQFLSNTEQLYKRQLQSCALEKKPRFVDYITTVNDLMEREIRVARSLLHQSTVSKLNELAFRMFLADQSDLIAGHLRERRGLATETAVVNMRTLGEEVRQLRRLANCLSAISEDHHQDAVDQQVNEYIKSKAYIIR